MENFKYLTPGEKIKKLRNNLKLTQNDLAEGITRSAISMIENNRQELTYYSANKISKKINKVIDQQNRDIKKIDSHYLMRKEKEEVLSYIEERINGLEQNIYSETESVANELIELIRKYDIGDQILKNVLIKSALSCFANKKYEVAKSFGLRAIHILGITKNYEESFDMLYLIAKISYQEKKFKESIDYLEYAIYIYDSNKLQSNDYNKLLFLNTLCHQRLGKHKEAHKRLDELQKQKLSAHQLQDVLSTRAACFSREKRFMEAKETYEKLRQLDLPDSKRILIDINLSEIAKEEGRYIEGLELLERTIGELKVKNKTILHLALNLYFEIESYIGKVSKSIVEIEEFVDKNYDETLIEHLVKYYIDNDEFDKLINFVDRCTYKDEAKNTVIKYLLENNSNIEIIEFLKQSKKS